MPADNLREEYDARRIILRCMLNDVAEADKLLKDADIRREVAGMIVSNTRDYLALRGAAPSAAPSEDTTTAAIVEAAIEAAPLDDAMTAAIEAAMTAAIKAATTAATDEFGLPIEKPL